MNRFGVLAVCLLVLSGPVLGCDWDRSVAEDQQLVSASMSMFEMKPMFEVMGPEACKEACCQDPDCDLVLVGLADGMSQCMRLRCTDPDRNRDLCVLQSSTSVKVYRKNQTSGAGERAPKSGHKSHIVPLIGPGSPKTSNRNSSAVCVQPLRVGPCRASFPKFFYDVTNQSCRSFMWGGCRSNDNNFNSREECEEVCRGVTGSVLPDDSSPGHLPKSPRMLFESSPEGPVEHAASESVLTQETGMSAADFAERCGAEPQVGPCRAAFQRWFHNESSGRCQPFIYGGCKGNKNNYGSLEECSATCTGVPSVKKVFVDVSAEYREACLVTSDPGPCRAAFSMFYYDPDTATCQSFIYGGCRGNKNRYSSKAECLSRCGADGSSETRGKTRDRWTAGVFLFVTLAAISALLLAALIIVTLRRHRLSRRPSSVSDKEELLPDERSSVESLAVPESPKPDQA